MKLSFRRPQEDPETEGRRLRERADAYGHKQTIRRIQEAAERRERAEESARLRREKIETRRQRRAERAARRAVIAAASRKYGEAFGRRLILVLPLLLVNSFAAFGQAGFAHDHFGWKIYAVIGFAATLESIALYIGYHAHAALMAGDSAMKLRLSSYLAGAVIGGLNYDHYAGSDGRPTALAVTFGLLSLMSPWLWAMHGRYKNRRRLEQLGLVDERAPHFSAAKWLHFPWQTLGALRYGIAHNLTDPSAAWVGYQRQRAEAKAGRRPRRLWRWLIWDDRPRVRVTVACFQNYTMAGHAGLYWAKGLSQRGLAPTGGPRTPRTRGHNIGATTRATAHGPQGHTTTAGATNAVPPKVAHDVGPTAANGIPPAVAGPTVVEFTPRGELQTAMRRHWDARVAVGEIPTGADLNRAVGKDSKYSLGKKYARAWRQGLPVEFVEAVEDGRTDDAAEIASDLTTVASEGVGS